jgi:flagellar protein FliO/FliZ
MMAAGIARLLGSVRGRTVLAGLLAVALAAVAVAPGGLAATGARAALAAAALGTATLLVRRRAGAPARGAGIAVLARAPLGRDSGLAVVEVGGRSLLVGFGRGGVSLLGDVPTARERAP